MIVEAELKGLVELGEADGHAPVTDLEDLARAELAVEAVEHLVADVEHREEDSA